MYVFNIIAMTEAEPKMKFVKTSLLRTSRLNSQDEIIPIPKVKIKKGDFPYIQITRISGIAITETIIRIDVFPNDILSIVLNIYI